MEILDKNTFTEEEVTIEVVKNKDRTISSMGNSTLVHIGKACYSLQDLEKIVNFAKKKDLNESLNYRIKKYTK